MGKFTLLSASADTFVQLSIIASQNKKLKKPLYAKKLFSVLERMYNHLRAVRPDLYGDDALLRQWSAWISAQEARGLPTTLVMSEVMKDAASQESVNGMVNLYQSLDEGVEVILDNELQGHDGVSVDFWLNDSPAIPSRKSMTDDGVRPIKILTSIYNSIDISKVSAPLRFVPFIALNKIRSKIARQQRSGKDGMLSSSDIDTIIKAVIILLCDPELSMKVALRHASDTLDGCIFDLKRTSSCSPALFESTMALWKQSCQHHQRKMKHKRDTLIQISSMLDLQQQSTNSSASSKKMSNQSFTPTLTFILRAMAILGAKHKHQWIPDDLAE